VVALVVDGEQGDAALVVGNDDIVDRGFLSRSSSIISSHVTPRESGGNCQGGISGPHAPPGGPCPETMSDSRGNLMRNEKQAN
jgi:hypothetical protein